MTHRSSIQIYDYDEKGAARILDVSARTLRSWRKKGLIGFHRTPTGRVRYTVDQLVEVQRNGRVAPKLGNPTLG